MRVVDQLVIDCLEAAAEGDAGAAVAEAVRRHVRDHRRALLDALSHCTDLVAWHQSPELTVLVLPTAPGFSFWPHDHRMWAVTAMVVGDEHNTLYRLEDRGPVAVSTFEISEATAVAHEPSIIHTAANLGSRISLGLHVFGGDPGAVSTREWDPVTGASRTADEATSARRRAAMTSFLEGQSGRS